MAAKSINTLSAAEARRIAVGSQEFGRRPAKPGLLHLRKLAASLHAFQIDSVNVVVRAHYLPAFARLGAYRVEDLDSLAYRKRELSNTGGTRRASCPSRFFPCSGTG